MDAGLRHRHGSGRTLHEEVHIINRPIRPDQIDAGEADAAAEVGQVFEVDPDELEVQLLLFVLDLEIAAVRLRLFGDMFLDPGGDVVDGDCGPGRRCLRQRRTRRHQQGGVDEPPQNKSVSCDHWFPFSRNRLELKLNSDL